MKKVVFIAVFLGLFYSSAFAQSQDGQAKNGSVYSKFGVGYPLPTSNVATQSMGLFGVSFDNPFVTNPTNPAHWGSVVYGMGSGGIGINTYNASNGSENVTNSNFSVNQFQLQLPIVRGKFGISGSFTPLTEASFQTVQQKTHYLGTGSQRDTLDYELQNRGNGGVNRAELGFGWKINSNISVGYAASLVFLSMDNGFSASFPQNPYLPVNYKIETSGVGFGNRIGTHIRVPGLFRSDDLLGIGATVNLPVSLDTEQKQTGSLQNGNITLTNDLPNGDGTIKMPMKVTGGISYSPSNLLLFGLEGLYEGWSNYENDFVASEQQFVDRYKLGFGVQYLPFVTGSRKFLSSFKYRAGISYDTGHLKLKGQRINTLLFSLGLGIRAPRSRSSIDLSFEYGLRGTNSANLVKEQIVGIRLSLNLTEVMFYRPKLQ